MLWNALDREKVTLCGPKALLLGESAAFPRTKIELKLLTKASHLGR